MPGARRRSEEIGIGRIGGEERRGKFRPDLVGRLGDARADAGMDPRRRGAQRDHRRHRRLEHAGDRAAPAGMGGADHAGLGIGKQHRRAIGGEDAERHAAPACTIASARGRAAGGQEASTTATLALCTWWQVARSSRVRSSAAMARRRFSATLSASSPSPARN